MSKLNIVNGQFIRDGKIETIEFGNKEQISLLKEYNHRLEGFKGKGLAIGFEVEVRYDATADFKCICGQNIYLENEAEGESDDDAIDSLEGITKVCSSCKQKYITSSENEELLVKFAK